MSRLQNITGNKCGRDYRVRENYEGDGRNMLPYSSVASSARYLYSCRKIIMSLYDANNTVYRHRM